MTRYSLPTLNWLDLPAEGRGSRSKRSSTLRPRPGSRRSASTIVSDDLSHESRHRRLPIGSGTFAIAEFVWALDSLGYRGVISAEILPIPFRQQEPLKGARTLMDAFRTHWRSHDPPSKTGVH